VPDTNEKARRRTVQRAAREHAKQNVRDGLSVPAPVLKALFDYVDQKLKSTECDNTLRHALDFIRNNALPEQAVVGWLKDNHGYCDCDTLWNSEEIVEEAIPGYRDVEPLQSCLDFVGETSPSLTMSASSRKVRKSSARADQ
jgi:hypothetical protein